MQILNLEESKKVATKFLKHIGRFDEKKINEYFSKDYTSKEKFASFFGIQTTSTYLFLYLDNPQNESEKLIQSFYPNNLRLSKDKIEKIENKFILALTRSLIKNSINNLYEATEFKKDLKTHRRLISFLPEEINKNIFLYRYPEAYLFSANNDFLFVNPMEEYIVLSGSNDFMNDFKNDLPEFKECVYDENDDNVGYCINCEK